MIDMAIPHSDDDGSIGRGRSFKNRQVSVYASRIKPTVTPLSIGLDSDDELVDDVPDLPPLPVSPRWDSLSNGAHIFLASAMPSNPPLPAQDSRPAVLTNGLSEAYGVPQPLDAALAYAGNDVTSNSLPESPRKPPSRPVTAKSSLADLRAHEAAMIENFSRPRKQSIKQPLIESPKPWSASSPPTGVLQEIANSAPQTPPWQRSRRPSVSSWKSTSTFASPLPAPVGDGAEVKLSKSRNVAGTPLPSGRPPFGNTRVDSSASAPVMGGTTPWLVGDELRSSFRSQLTTSTGPGTAVTERSSVLTKDSSVASLYANADEPSLEEFLGMYEKGFADDSDTSESEEIQDSRPLTAMSEPGPRLKLMKTTSADQSVPPVPRAPATLASPEATIPEVHSSLDAEIRQSKMIFTSPAFTSSVAAIANNLDAEDTIKRGSTRSVASDPSIASESIANAVVHTASPPTTSATASASPSPSPSPSITPSSNPITLPQSQPEDPGSRDRYGFKKQSQHVTRQDYDAWNKEYSLYLARRRRKWTSYLKDSTLMTDRPIRFPAPNAKTKRFVRKGIPPDWRGAAWFYYAGGPAILAKHSGLYEKLLHKKAKQIDDEAIERDLHRTFPDNIQFKPSEDFPTPSSSERTSQSTMTGSASSDNVPGPRGADGEPPIITSLRRVLHAFSVYNPRIGYCQSLNFLAGLLLLFVETEEQCFWLLNVITRIYLPGTHEMSLEGSKVDLGVLMTELRDTMPAVWEKIGGELEGDPNHRSATTKSIRIPKPRLKRKDLPGLSTDRLPPITLCMTAWFMSCFIGTLPIETTLRVWDVFFYEGSKTLFRVALSIFKLGESEIKAVSDPMEMFGVVQSLPRRMLDANALMDACFKRRNGFGHLSQDVIEERRQVRRDQTQQDRELLLQRGKSVTTDGHATSVQTAVPRQGTLFGRRKRDPSRTRPAEV